MNRASQVAELLLKAKVIDELQMRSALRELEKWGGRLTKILGDMKLAPEEKVVQAIADGIRLTTVDLAQITKDAAALAKLDAGTCETQGVFPCALKDQGKTLWLAMADPTDFETVEDIERRVRCRLKLVVGGETTIKSAIDRYYHGIEPRPGAGQGKPEAQASGLDLAPSTGGELLDARGDQLSNKAPPTKPRAAPARPVADASPGADLFDFVPEAFTPEEQSRLEALKINQEKGAKVLRAVLELCVEKGLLSSADADKLEP